MGFDQYHEPPNELSQETRTFARMIASLIEEAEAINWYEQRMSVENDVQEGDHGQRPEGRVFALRRESRISPAAQARVGHRIARHPVSVGRHRRARRAG